jgi:hypothetical protein
VSAEPGFGKRVEFVSLVHQGRMWVIGGIDSEGRFLNDVWSSQDGVAWEQASPAAAFCPRWAFTGFAFKGRLWISSGIDGTRFLNDVWWSE